ncbi:hypothetical protein [Stutzerimonas stutzeri]|uniref:hypothetical protein n=1 Tax=Stutzerimonas stutzeri TaxID=316 RepID=UPI003724AF36
MSNQFKPGDLALTLVEGVDWPAATTVTLISFLPCGGRAVEPNGFNWIAEYDQWVVMREGDPVADCFKPAQLMPLRGDFQPERQQSREVAA